MGPRPRTRPCSPFGSQRCIFYLISLPFRCKLKAALIQSAFPPDRRWYLVVKTASVQLKDVFTNHTDTFLLQDKLVSLCTNCYVSVFSFFSFFLRRRSHCFLTLRFTDTNVSLRTLNEMLNSLHMMYFFSLLWIPDTRL